MCVSLENAPEGHLNEPYYMSAHISHDSWSLDIVFAIYNVFRCLKIPLSGNLFPVHVLNDDIS